MREDHKGEDQVPVVMNRRYKAVPVAGNVEYLSGGSWPDTEGGAAIRYKLYQDLTINS